MLEKALKVLDEISNIILILQTCRVKSVN
jgi:hypothetical protein